ncbi:unnamed protein product [Linum tenue]|uniref:Cyanobacterial aminoacyl-tRNA synthetase CAAD domain-containing protein n=1 Tax=Linum tenue TaxID=586396 RepID=A0AAV0PTU4_9ROSI|nr:unnamed protein product [Linum tenue]
MEICTCQTTLSSLPRLPTSTVNAAGLLSSSSAAALPCLHYSRSLSASRSLRFTARASEDSSTGANTPYIVGGTGDFGESSSATKVAEEKVPAAVKPKVIYNENGAPENEGPAFTESLNEFLSDLNLKFDSEDTVSLVIYGSGALLALWLTSAVVSAVDSIPLFPKLMEVVGLGYTFWFTTRYLLFKKNREELATKVEELKQQVLGTKD